jgi:vancomycin resistance protein YoaR
MLPSAVPKVMSFLIRASICTVLLGTVAGGAAYAHRTLLPPGRLLPGLMVDGAPVPMEIAGADDAAIAGWIEGRAATVLDREVELRAGTSARRVKLRELAAPFDAAALVPRLRSFGREGTITKRIDDALRARDGAIDLPIVLAIDPEKVEPIVVAMKGEVDDAPVDAKLDLAAHGIVHDKLGHSLEVDGAVAKAVGSLVPLARDPATTLPTLDLPVVELSPRITEAGLAKLDISTVLASYETHFGRDGNQAPRAANIEVAARKLDGLVMQPGTLVSFNQVVGERSEANGFKVAWEIFKGEMRPGVGGGTCQVASTFHAASFYAGLDIVERSPHSRPSAYMPLSMDATVVWPVVDLKLRNPFTFPVVVHTDVKGTRLLVEILGPKKMVDVKFASDVVEKFPYVRRIDEEPWVAEGKTIKKQGGIFGYRVRRVRTLKPLDGGPPRSEVTFDFYPPTVEIWLVPTGYDPNELPALPDEVQEALDRKKGKPPATDAVACAGECGKPKPRDPSAPYE